MRCKAKTCAILLALIASSAARRALAEQRGFVDVLAGSGITFRHQYIPGESGPGYKVNQYDHGSGLLVVDYDGDAFDDLYFLNFLGDNALYRNRGDGTFEDATARAGVAMSGKICVGGAFGDFDNDGDPDLYVTSYRGGNQLFRNNGDGTFTDVTAQTGTGYAGHSSAAVFFDYDKDGDLDLYVANIGRFTTNLFDRALGYYVGFALPVRGLLDQSLEAGGEPNLLYRNDGAGPWPDVAQQAGVAAAGWNGDASAADYDLDGDLDLYTTNMFGENVLYRNDGGKFQDVTHEALGRTSWGAVGGLFFDANDDGLPELVVVDMHSDMWLDPVEGWISSLDTGAGDMEILRRMEAAKDKFIKSGWDVAKFDTPLGPKAESMKLVTGKVDETRVPHVIFGNSFFFNRGNGRFEEASDRVGLETFWPWGIAAGDLDNDGDVDLFIASGMGFPYFYWPNQVFLNQGGTHFAERARELGIEPPVRGEMVEGAEIRDIPFMRSSRAAAFLDLENDGDLDIVTNNFNDAPYLLRNDLPRQNYLDLWLDGAKSNRDAIGARVMVQAGGREQHRQVTGAGGYLTQGRRTLHFGLGQATRVDKVTVTWPDGKTQVLSDLEENRLHKIRKPEP